ncbi:MAG: Modification methylase MboII [Ignavibacteria bacterium ADurb.Bin266]|nr:MAG: Modification methylase MboII [Ignavibacteria bacterium ADurb.Bin266]
MIDGIKLLKGDCLELMRDIPDKSIDAIICDLPFGSTSLAWDIIIPFEYLWKEYERIIKDNGAIVLFGSQPFTSMLIMSNLKWFKYEWIWKKNTGSGFATAKYMPMKYHEHILVFGRGRINYYPIPTKRNSEESINRSKYAMNVCKDNTSNHIPMKRFKTIYDSETKSPESVLEFKSVPNARNKIHPTQKPVELIEYLIKTYTNEGEFILDNAMGSGTTGIACINTNRRFVGIEKDDKYFEIANNRIKNHIQQLSITI